MSYSEGDRIGTTGFECIICYGGTHGLYDKEMMDEQLKSQLQHRIVLEGDSTMHELSEMCAVGHMCCTTCHKQLILLPRKACPTCRGKLLPIDSRKIRLFENVPNVPLPPPCPRQQHDLFHSPPPFSISTLTKKN